VSAAKETIGRPKAASVRPFYRPVRAPGQKRISGGWGVAVDGRELAGRWDSFQEAWDAGVAKAQEAAA